MSEVILKLIPFNIGIIPENMDIDILKAFLDKIDFNYENINLKLQNNVSFVDCGQNLSSIKCNHCFSDASEWWAEYMTESEENNYTNRMFITPCCSKNSSLEDLKYNHQVGFSRFILEISNPSRNITDEELVKISNIFRCTLKIIVARY